MAKTTGNLCKAIWTDGGATQGITVSRAYAQEIGGSVPKTNTTSQTATAAEFTPGIPEYIAGLDLWVDSSDATPTLPVGTLGKLEILWKGGNAGGSGWATGSSGAFVESMRFESQAPGGPAERIHYRFCISGTVTTT